MKKYLNEQIKNYVTTFKTLPAYIILNPFDLAKLREDLKINILDDFTSFRNIKIKVDIEIDKLLLLNDSSIGHYKINC